jgi:hypothetical protein
MPEIDDHRQCCPERAAAVASLHRLEALEAAMCHWSSHEYERRVRADPTRSFFQALRDLFRRKQEPQVEAPEVQAEVIPLARAAARRSSKEATKRADAA